MKIQCKDISTIRILKFLKERWDKGECPSTRFDGYDNSIGQAMPDNTPDKVRRAKMRKLMRRGLVDGCDCGCRGDYEITEKGEEYLNSSGGIPSLKFSSVRIKTK